jgi:hypothetical protein
MSATLAAIKVSQIDELPVSGDILSRAAEPFTPSSGDLWHQPGVFAC